MLRRLFKPFRKRSISTAVETGETSSAVWSIGIYEGDSPLNLEPANAAGNPVLTAKQVTDVRARFVADPFMMETPSGWFMFFEVEEIRSDNPKGVIGMAASPDGRSWRYGGIVLREGFHLSYPYVFAHEGAYFMIPETRAIRKVCLYRATDFPHRWRLEKTLLSRRRFADSSVVRYSGRWWMFTDSGNTTLRLYSAETLTGRWREHPRSPLVRKDPRTARPAGRVVPDGDGLIRFAQDGSEGYGRRVRAFRISILTPTAYEETAHPEMVAEASGSGWNRAGMHTVDPHPLPDGRWIACVDGFGTPEPEDD